MKPYYSDDAVTIYHGDSREVWPWDIPDAVMVTDPPYGRGWKQCRLKRCDDSHAGIAGDIDTAVRDAVLAIWGDRPAIVFGDLMLPPPPGNPSSPQGKWGHPHVKPHDVMCRLIEAVPLQRSVIVDPFMGTGSTLRAAKDLGHDAIGVEVDVNYCRTAAKRMAQEVLDFGGAA